MRHEQMIQKGDEDEAVADVTWRLWWWFHINVRLSRDRRWSQHCTLLSNKEFKK